MRSSPGRSAFASDGPPGNPFATRFTRPGAIPPLAADGRPLDLTALAARLHSLGSAAIVGPHGHGKSTLLVALADELAAAGSTVTAVRVRSWRDAIAAGRAICSLAAGGVACIDGWESLGPLRPTVGLLARWLGRRLLITVHGHTALPVLHRCGTTPDLLHAIVARLPDRGGRITAADVDDAFRRHGGDLRKSISDLYDRFERHGQPLRPG